MLYKFVSKIIDFANPILDEYNKGCVYVTPHINSKFEFIPNFSNERSIASFMSNQFYGNICKHGGFDKIVLINEFAFRLDSPITTKRFEELKQNHGLSHVKTPKHSLRQFCPDSYFHIVENNVRLDVFVEYKVSSKFILAQLSYDFLKYILYTQKSTSDSGFLYILFRKKGSDPLHFISDAFHLPKHYILKGADLDSELALIRDEISIFSYANSKKPGFDDEAYLEFDVLREINNTIDEVQEEYIDEDKIINAVDFSENPFVCHMYMFGENVITSEHIRNNFLKILKVKEYVVSMDSINNHLSADIEMNTEILSRKKAISDKSTFVKNIASYFHNHINKLLKHIKQNKSVLNFSYRRSNWILIIIAKFLELNTPKDEKPIFSIREFCENDDDAEEVSAILKQAYDEKTEFTNNINSLALSLIFYITEVYPIIIDNTDNGPVLKHDYIAYKKKGRLLDLIHDFYRINTGKKKMKKRAWDDVNVEDAILDIAKWIFDKYVVRG